MGENRHVFAETVEIELVERGIEELHATLGPASAWFPGRRVLQVPVAGLDPLAAAVDVVTAAWGPRRAEPSFNGHLTLARARGRTAGPADLAGVALSAQWAVREITLFSSTLGSGAAHYEPVAVIAVP